MILLSFFLFAAVPASDIGEAIEIGRLRAHVETLASKEYGGRGAGEDSRKAAAYVARTFEEIGLAPAGEKGWYGEIPDPKDPAKVLGRNVLGLLRGGDPKLRDEHVVLGAHHDHLGRSGETFFPGADDNATGVAALIEAARALAGAKASPRRSILFVSFDLEETGLRGSNRFVRKPAVPLESIALYVNLDMLGRDMGGFIEGYLFVLGAENCPGMKPAVRAAAAGETLRAGFVGTDIIGIRGDYGPFRERKIPYLFFGTGEHPDYHRPTDTADRILYEKLLRGTRIVTRAVLAAADAAERPAWSEPTPDLDEVRVLADVVDQTAKKSKDLGLGREEMAGLSMIRFSVGEILERGAITAEERERLKGIAVGMLESFRRK
jgi:hypothetical protein